MLNFRRLLRPFLKVLGKSLVKFPITEYDVNDLPSEHPIIFVTNHNNVHDFPILISIIEKSFFVLADDAPKGTPAGIAISASGAIWVHRTDKQSRKASVISMKEHLKKGHNILIFAEGTWNMHECLPILPLTWTTTELAKEYKCPIVPIVLDYPDFQSCYYSIGKPLFISEEMNKVFATNLLRDTMSTMRWNIWESRGIFPRDCISNEDYNQYTKERIKEYKPDNWEDFFKKEKEWVFHPYTTPEKAYEHLYNLNPKKENAFLFNKRLSS